MMLIRGGVIKPGALVGLWLLMSIHASAVAGDVPRPLPVHPGNVFQRGEPVHVQLPQRQQPWRLVDYDGDDLGGYQGGDDAVELGQLPSGFYRFLGANTNDWISLAVVEPLRTAIAKSSPISVDAGFAWGIPSNQWAQAAKLCRLAGINWVRDRLSWPEVQPAKDGALVTDRYDQSLAVQTEAGLRVLQVMHATPKWAGEDASRFPEDLRDAYQFYRSMAQRWRGKVQAFESWNEADLTRFGGHIGSEMASLQKAAYLGLKAGNPKIIVGQNVFASHEADQLTNFAANEAWPYFDTFNLHHYESLRDYPRLYADFRARAAGRSLWVTEFSVPMTWSGDSLLKELTEDKLKLQSELLVKSYASSLHQGSAAAFYFILHDYVEEQTQFGILRRDLTPRPAFASLAAVGRLLMNSRSAGRLVDQNALVRGYRFAAEIDGKREDVLVVWSDSGEARLQLPRTPRAVYDHLGRAMPVADDLRIGSQPRFIVLSRYCARWMSWELPPEPLPFVKQRPASVVMQAVWPRAQTHLGYSAYQVGTNAPTRLPVYLYNFGAKTVRGVLQVATGNGWSASTEHEVEIVPQERKRIYLEINSSGVPKQIGTVTLRGEFGAGGNAVLGLRLLND